MDTLDYVIWLVEIEQLTGDDFGMMAEVYSFEAAYEDRLTPVEAVKDCREWLEG